MIRAILTDIEGTTSSLSFVKEVLFPYSREHMSQFIAGHATEPEVARELEEVSRLTGRELSITEATHQLIEWIDQDRKATPLKALQGMIWASGYQNGDFHGHIYEDAVRKLRAWKAEGLFLHVFSSGSVPAQKLLFAHTEYGDLTPLFSGYFDTRMGPKQESASYTAIARQIGVPGENILFLSDIDGELDAAQQAGLKTVKLQREGELLSKNRHVTVQNFDEIVV
jgi:enolase-phosphatase E1